MRMEQKVHPVYVLELTQEEVNALATISAYYDEGEVKDKTFDFSVALEALLVPFTT
jgi:hypothetical protein